MSRVSQLELYNDKDVITQILLMKEQVETGTYKEVRVIETGGNYVFEFINQKDGPETFTVPAKQISGVTSSQAGSTVTMRVTYNDGTYQDVSWTAGGDVTTDTAQSISAVKTFTVSPIVPNTPSEPSAAVNVAYVESTVPGTNNIMHKTGNEDVPGYKRFTGLLPSMKTVARTQQTDPWWKLWEADADTIQTNGHIMFELFPNRQNYGLIRIALSSTPSITRYPADSYPVNSIIVTIKDGHWTVWAKRVDSTARIMGRMIYECNVNYTPHNIFQVSTDGAGYPEPQVADYDTLVIG